MQAWGEGCGNAAVGTQVRQRSTVECRVSMQRCQRDVPDDEAQGHCIDGCLTRIGYDDQGEPHPVGMGHQVIPVYRLEG